MIADVAISTIVLLGALIAGYIVLVGVWSIMERVFTNGYQFNS